MSKTKKILLTAAAAVLILSALGGSFLAGFAFGHGGQFISVDAAANEKAMSLDLAQEVWRYIDESYVDDINQEKLGQGAAKGVVDAIGDPYSRFMAKKDYEFLNEETHGSFFGVGIELGMKDDFLTVVTPIEGTPGFRAGIKSGDVIVKIDGKSTEGMSIDKAISLIRGPKGSPVTLTIAREDQKGMKDYKIIRDEIVMPNVSARLLEDKIGYIHLHMFNEKTAEVVKEKIDDLIKQGMNAAIIDLRNNPGGLFEESIDLASMFIEEGTIVSIIGKDTPPETFSAHGDAYDFPIVVLINEGSASASEIFAGAIQDYDRGRLVGKKSFGKGVIQTVFDLSDGSGLTLTTAKYYTPKGRSIHKKGIKPDVTVSIPKKDKSKKDIQLDKAIEVLKKSMLGR